MAAPLPQTTAQSVAPERPGDVVARARVMGDAGDVAGALGLLQARRPDWAGVPPVYEAMLGRYSLRTGDAAGAVSHLQRARDAYGAAMPPEQLRDLAMALLEQGQVEEAGRAFTMAEAAGAKVVRAAHRAAIEAFRHAASGGADRGQASDPAEPRPYSVLAQAMVLAERGAFDAARHLLLAGADRAMGRVAFPAAYHAMLGRLLLRAGDKTGAITHLTQARAADEAGFSPALLAALGTALFETARFDEAGVVLDAALAAGAAILRCDLLIAVSEHRRQGGEAAAAVQIATHNAANLTFFDAQRRLVYVGIPKNACTVLKTLFVRNSPHATQFAAGRQSIYHFCDGLAQARPAGWTPPAGSFRLIVLRDPHHRLVSAYLDKFVRQRDNPESYEKAQRSRTIRSVQALHGIDYDPVRSISFAEFVRWISVTDDVALDMHWMPQWRMAGSDLAAYDHVGTVARLDATLDLLATRFGFDVTQHEAAGLVRGRRHAARYDAAVEARDPGRMLPHELDAFEAGMPLPELFYTRALKQLVRKRYEADFVLLARAADRPAGASGSASGGAFGGAQGTVGQRV